MPVTLTILGCGSSAGVPRVGNNWGACDPSNSRNRRRRCSVLLERPGSEGTTRVLIDAGPDLREQLLDADVGEVDHVLITHEHADHVHGIDDLRAVALNMRQRVPVWCDDRTRDMMLERFGYCFRTPPGSDYPPILTMQRLTDYEPVTCTGAGGDISLVPFVVHHGSIDVLGFRVGDVAYTPDLNGIPDASLDYVSALDTWIIDALRPTPHPSHLSLPETLGWIERMAPRRAVLTNLHIDQDYETLEHSTPDHVSVAYDGMKIEVD